MPADSAKNQPIREVSFLNLSFLAVLVGVVAGVGAVLFRALIAFFHNVFFLGKFSFAYDATLHTPASPWGAFVILVPVVGALGVVFLVKNFAPEAKGHGVPEVMEAIYYKKGVIRPIVALIKSLASALSIGSGGSVGREGPIIQIGSSFGSTLGQLIKMRTWQRITLIAAGAGGGIAATFNTPVGGILFAIEIMLQEISVRTLVPVSLATATATYIGRLYFGESPSFDIPGLSLNYFHMTDPWVLLTYIGLGLLMGAVSALYIKSIYAFEDFFDDKIKGSYYLRHTLGMLLVGIMMYLCYDYFGEYYIQGVGYATIQDILSSKLTVLYLLLLLPVLKLLAVSLTLGSGASGGVFSPGLYMGATLGGAYGIILGMLFPNLSVAPTAFAVAGMAGVIGGSTGAAMAAIVMIFEMTLDYNVIIPMTLTVAISYGIRKVLVSDSIYTLKLARRGRYMPEALQANYHHEIEASDVMDTKFDSIQSGTSVETFVDKVFSQENVPWYLRVDENDQVTGVIARDTGMKAYLRKNKSQTLDQLDTTAFVTVHQDTKLFRIINQIGDSDKNLALVIDCDKDPKLDNVKGIITRENIAKVMAQAMELYSE